MSQASVRHRFLDRLFHWLFALLMLLMLATGLLPPLGFRFDWLPWHWMGGLVMLVLLLWHTLRSLIWKNPREMLGFARPGIPGKYSREQKLMHHAVALTALVAVITGVLMLVRIDTPLWRRNPYWLEAGNWGLIYVLHGLAALSLLSLIMLHIYFSLRPEKRHFLKAMIHGRPSSENTDSHDRTQ